MKYYRKYNPAGRWTEIKGTDMLKVISSHFDETTSTAFDGTAKPTRQQVADHIHSGNILHLYTADYKAEETTIDSELVRMQSPERAAYVAEREQVMHDRVQELKQAIKQAKENEADFPMVAGEGAPQYTFAVENEQQLALF